MKKKALALALAAVACFALTAGCSGKDSGTNSAAPSDNGGSGETVTLKIGRHPRPPLRDPRAGVSPSWLSRASIWSIVVYNDYNTPNDAVEDGALDANYFQHMHLS